MKNRISFIRVIIFIALLQGCSTPYFGHTEEGWNRLSEEQRLAIKKEYELAIDYKNSQRHRDKIDARTQSIIDRGVEGPIN